MMRALVGSSRHLAVRGVAALLFGLATLVWPGITLWALVVMWGAFVFVDGIVSLSAAIGDSLLAHRGWAAFWGVTGILAGIVTFVWPSITAMALLFVIAVWAFVIGVSLVALAISEHEQISDAWLVGLTGVLSLLLSLVMVINPVDGAIGITWAIGWWAILYGGLTLSLAWSVHKETHDLERAGLSTSRPGPVLS